MGKDIMAGKYMARLGNRKSSNLTIIEGRSKGHKAFLVRKGIQIKGRLAKRRDHQ